MESFRNFKCLSHVRKTARDPNNSKEDFKNYQKKNQSNFETLKNSEKFSHETPGMNLSTEQNIPVDSTFYEYLPNYRNGSEFSCIRKLNPRDHINCKVA